MINIYGIPNCDTVKKATAWLNENEISFQFHDFKKEGVQIAKLKEWLAKLPSEKLLNKKSTAWRALTPAEQLLSTDAKGAIQLMATYTNLIKRPVVEISGTILTGFSEAAYIKAF